MQLFATVGGEEERPPEPATPESVRAALYPAKLWYGAEFELRPADPAAPRLSAVSVTNVYVGPEEPAEFLLGLEECGVWYSEAGGRRFSREEVLAYFLRYAAGEWAWLDEVRWVELAGGRRTGRYRARAV